LHEQTSTVQSIHIIVLSGLLKLPEEEWYHAAKGIQTDAGDLWFDFNGDE
jgi:hypothetical protein